MSPRHFSNMYKQTSHRHDQPSDGEVFNRDFKVLTGMLYSIVTLKAFFPFFKSPAEITDSTVTHAPYPMPSKIAGDPKKQYTQLTLW